MELPINRTSTYAVSRLMIIIILSFTACLAVLAYSYISTLRLADTIKIVQNKRAATELELLGDGIASLMEKCGNWASRL